MLTGQTWLISSWPWNLFEKHVFPLSFSPLCLDITKLWRSKSYFCRTESYIIEGDFALPLISCVLCCYRCLWCTSGFGVGPLAVFFVHFPLRWYRKISWSIYHFYADDTQLYLSFETSSPEDLSTFTSALEDCVNDIDLWMLNNKLKLNSTVGRLKL